MYNIRIKSEKYYKIRFQRLKMADNQWQSSCLGFRIQRVVLLECDMPGFEITR